MPSRWGVGSWSWAILKNRRPFRVGCWWETCVTLWFLLFLFLFLILCIFIFIFSVKTQFPSEFQRITYSQNIYNSLVPNTWHTTCIIRCTTAHKSGVFLAWQTNSVAIKAPTESIIHQKITILTHQLLEELHKRISWESYLHVCQMHQLRNSIR